MSELNIIVTSSNVHRAQKSSATIPKVWKTYELMLQVHNNPQDSIDLFWKAIHMYRQKKMIINL